MLNTPIFTTTNFSIELNKSVRAKGSLGGYEGTIVSMASSPDGVQIVAASEDGRLWLWDDVSESRPNFWRKIANSPVTDVDWSDDGRLLACCTRGGSVIICDARTLKPKGVKNIARDSLTRIAWSPHNDRVAVAGADRKIYIIERINTEDWNIQTGTGHYSAVRSITWSHDGTRIISGTDAGVVGVWSESRVDNQLRHFLPGPDPWSHESPVIDLASSPQSDMLGSLSDDGTIRFWDTSKTVPLGSIDCGEPAFRLSFAFGGRVVIARTLKKLRIIDCEQMKEIFSFSCPAHPDHGFMAVNSASRQIAADNLREHCIQVWEVDFAYLFANSRVSKQRYRCAKVIVLGGPDVGKSTLVRSLARTKPADEGTEHGLEVHRLERKEIASDAGDTSEIREIMLWDLPNRSDSELLQRLRPFDATALLFLFDWQAASAALSEFNPLKQIAGYSDACTADNSPRRLFIVGTKADRARNAEDLGLYSRLCRHFKVDTIFSTSSQDPPGLEELRVAIWNSINWDDVPAIEPAHILDHLRRFVEERTARGTIIDTEEGLYSLFVALNPSLEPFVSQAVFHRGLEVLGRRGLVHRFSLGGLILLEPSYFERYTAALTRTARNDEHCLGRLLIEGAKQSKFLEISKGERVPDLGQEELLLNGVISDLVERKLGYKVATNEGSYLVLPTQCTREFLDAPSKAQQAALVRFEGDSKTVYSSLVVRLLALKAFFNKPELYENAATFKAVSGGLCGLTSTSLPEIQAGEIAVFFDDEAGHLTRQTFLRVVEDHLEGSTEHHSLRLSDECAKLADQKSALAKVFICYEPEDFQDVSVIARELENRKISPWIAEVQLVAGDKKDRKTSAMKCHSVAVFALRASTLSRSLQRDLAFFKSRDCGVIPVILPRASTRFQMPESLKEYRFVDFRSLGQAPYDELAKGIIAHDRGREESSVTTNQSNNKCDLRDDGSKRPFGQVFLSYCHDDEALASRLRRKLEAGGHSVWWDKKIKPGEDWKMSVRAAMQNAYAVVICFSSKTAARSSSGIYRELNDAIDIYADLPPGSIYLIPVLFSDCELPDMRVAVSTWLRDIQAIKLFGSKRNDRLRELLESLQAARARRNRSMTA